MNFQSPDSLHHAHILMVPRDIPGRSIQAFRYSERYVMSRGGGDYFQWDSTEAGSPCSSP